MPVEASLKSLNPKRLCYSEDNLLTVTRIINTNACTAPKKTTSLVLVPIRWVCTEVGLPYLSPKSSCICAELLYMGRRGRQFRLELTMFCIFNRRITDNSVILYYENDRSISIIAYQYGLRCAPSPAPLL